MKTFEEFLSENRSYQKTLEQMVKKNFGKDASKIEVVYDDQMEEYTINSIDPEKFNPTVRDFKRLVSALKTSGYRVNIYRTDYNNDITQTILEVIPPKR